MKLPLLVLLCLTSTLWAQGFTQGPTVIAKPANEADKGIKLKPGWDKLLTQSTRTANVDMIALRKIFEPFGEPKSDLLPHPECMVFPGIPYLTPQKKALDILSAKFGSFGLGSGGAIATEGIPLGLKFRRYDHAKLGNYKHVYIIVDEFDQVVSIGFKAQRSDLPFTPTPSEYIYRYMGPVARDNLIEKREVGSHAFVSDRRKEDQYIVVVHNSFPIPTRFCRFVPGHPPGIVVSDRTTDMSTVRGGINVTWFLPQPLINLILYTSRVAD